MIDFFQKETDNKTKVNAYHSKLSNKKINAGRRAVKERLASPSVIEDSNGVPTDNISDTSEKPEPGNASSALTEVVIC